MAEDKKSFIDDETVYSIAKNTLKNFKHFQRLNEIIKNPAFTYVLLFQAEHPATTPYFGNLVNNGLGVAEIYTSFYSFILPEGWKNAGLKGHAFIGDFLLDLVSKQTGIPVEKLEKVFSKRTSEKAVKEDLKRLPLDREHRAKALLEIRRSNLDPLITGVDVIKKMAEPFAEYPDMETDALMIAAQNAAANLVIKRILHKSRSPERTLDLMQELFFDENGNMLESVKESAWLGPSIEKLQDFIPEELKNTFSDESEMYRFAFATLRRMISTEEGKERFWHFLDNPPSLPEIPQPGQKIYTGKKVQENVQVEEKKEEVQEQTQEEVQKKKVVQEEDDDAPLNGFWERLHSDAQMLEVKWKRKYPSRDWYRETQKNNKNPPPTPVWEHKNASGNTFVSLVGINAVQEFLLNYKNRYPKLKDNIFDKDDKGRLTLKEDIHPEIKKLILTIQGQFLPEISKDGKKKMPENIDKAAAGLAVHIFDNLMSNAKKRYVLSVFLNNPNNPENIALLERAIQGAFADALEQDKTTTTLTLLQETLFEEKNGGYAVRDSVKNSQFGPLIQKLRERLPLQIQSIPEEQLNKFVFLSLVVMTTTPPDGKKELVRVLRDLNKNKSIEEILPSGTRRNSFGAHFTKASLRLLSHEWKTFGPHFKNFTNQILETDTVSGGRKLKKGIDPTLKDMILSIQKQIPPVVSEYIDKDHQLGVAVSVFEKLMERCSETPEKGVAFRRYVLDPENPENIKALAQPIQEVVADILADPSDKSLLATILNKQTGISVDVLKNDLIPMAHSVVTEMPVEGVERAINNDPSAVIDAVFDNLAIRCNQDYQGTLDVLQHTFFDKDGKIPDSVKNSKLLGPVVKDLLDFIPKEIKNAMPPDEGRLSQFTFAVLSRMGKTAEGRALISNIFSGLGSGLNALPFQKLGVSREKRLPFLLVKQNENHNSFMTLFGKSVAQEFLANNQWDQDYNRLKDEIFVKDIKTGRLKIKENLSPYIQSFVTFSKGVVKQKFSGYVTNEDNQLGIAVGVLQEILNDPEKRKILLAYTSNPKDEKIKKQVSKTMAEAAAKFLTSNANKILLAQTVKDIFMTKVPNDDQSKEGIDKFEADATLFANGVGNILLNDKKMLTGAANGLEFNSDGTPTAEGKKNAVKHVKECILDDLEKGAINRSARAALSVALRRINLLGLPDDLASGLADVLTKKEMVPVLRKVLPEDLMDSEAWPTAQKEFLELLKKPEWRKQIVSAFKDSKSFRCALGSYVVTTQMKLAKEYADPLAQFLSDDQRFEKVLEVIGKAHFEKGKLTNKGALISEAIPDMLKNEDDRLAFAEAATPMVRAPFFIPTGNKKKDISPFAIALTHFLTSKDLKDFMERPIIGVDGKKYDNISAYLAGSEMQSEFDRLNAYEPPKEPKEPIKAIIGKDPNDYVKVLHKYLKLQKEKEESREKYKKSLEERSESFKNVLKATWARQWKAAMERVFPNDATFKNYKSVVADNPTMALKTQDMGGPIPGTWESILWGSFLGSGDWLHVWEGVGCLGHALFTHPRLFRAKQAVENGKAIKVDFTVLEAKGEQSSSSRSVQVKGRQEPTKEPTKRAPASRQPDRAVLVDKKKKSR
ncbi:MAG: hypothetical protein IKQ99_02300 [Alphaproteobacteria bacterium]|nr:hypothetical protein [Alphaproteobacteria bacterium]